MSIKKFDTKSLDLILEKMIETVGTSKDEIFRIGEQCRKDYETLTEELKDVKHMVIKVIDEGDRLEGQTRFARKRLSEVSMHFKDYTEAQVRDAYEKAHQLQMDLSMNRQLEKQLRDRRDDIERRLVGVSDTIERAEHLISQITVVMNYLMSDIKQMGEMLEDAKMKQEFGLKIIEAQEEERKRLSREIHDGPAQMMANVMMRSDLIERVYKERGTDEAMIEIRNLKKMVRSALYEVRRIIYDLRPMALDDLGLVPTLKKYLQTTEEYHKQTKISFMNIGKEIRLPSQYEVALFRLIQEAVQNAIKHAESNEIAVKLEINKMRVAVVIKDDGKGFDINEKKAQSFGIIGMRERVELLEGQLSIDSHIGKGTIVIIQIPLNL
ncbi:two-component system, NarL family, sensor histidine kinase DegS [Cytobacillus horneckiae]|uniref:Signal transduction histidine-protein kinase/phosphatase DegS n=1 Tax=Cytobacillus horneckiae TaxID=549687 RepID=A0A2N0ZBK2_9BACI|nr:sensor histidine kinase [Cytobacillus horneckiae]NRG46987.1 sensor histidine kinase [Bacillus sp. CRN 9]MBN6885283.1 sensor histidine kinase [Cytobacillus horneckiae]MCM3178988.1 sensor histidine kinase [Cytobacillus horneckiae]MEC1154204.1 sensor histidine kinase [Cytobacillus horneckiae]MED2936251.1 sensor histidine kinase [Cytobacillus horneckiae]